ncbi:MAG: M13 family metallopeptidase [Deltaproteobacteria bacterium]|nr:M13 family metallopeptidase [Deltaproteobacteria bacterium]
MRNKRTLAVVALFAVSSCKSTEPKKDDAAQATKPAAPAPAELPVPPGVDVSIMDATTDPCTDFYQHACGGWLAKTEIPADRAAWSRGFMEIHQQNEQRLKEILEELAAGKAPEGTPYAKETGDFFASCMDEKDQEGGSATVTEQLKAIEKVKDAKTLLPVLAAMHGMGVYPFFHFASAVDFKDSTKVIAELDQAGLGLPDRDYYTKTDEKSVQIQKDYVEHVAKVLVLAGQKEADAKKNADAIYALEKQLAEASLTKVERREPSKLYHPTDLAGLKKAAGNLDWPAYFKAMGVPDVKGGNVTHIGFLEKVGAVLKATKAPELKAYLSWQFLSAVAPFLGKGFVDEDFRFKSKALTGAKEDLPRWKKCVTFTDMFLGEAVAVPFVAKYFGEDGKKITRELVANIEKAFEDNLATLAWMDAPTKEKALGKLKTIMNKVGYPDTWRKYDGVKIARGNFAANAGSLAQFEARRDLGKIGKPVDRTEWYMSPPTVNAYYNPQWNEIVFPAGILQPPFFNKDATAPVNYGAMGMVVGHEVTHGFDDEGRQFDAQGNLTDWWTAESAKAFSERTACVKTQYDGYTAIEDIKINGQLTLGENTADLGGLKLSFMAMMLATKDNADLKKFKYTPQQQFFYGYAQSWCSKYRDEMARMRAATDPHSPPKWRVNGPLGNLATFKEAFACKDDAPMMQPAANRCEVW